MRRQREQRRVTRQAGIGSSRSTQPTIYRNALDALPLEYWINHLVYVRILPDEVRNQIRGYTRKLDRELNRRLRSGWEGHASRVLVDFPADQKTDIITLASLQSLQNAVLMAPPLPTDILVFRGLTSKSHPKVGESTILHGMQSWTISPSIAEEFGKNVIVARARAGTPALWLPPLSHFEELELLFPHETVLTCLGHLPGDWHRFRDVEENREGGLERFETEIYGPTWMFDLAFPTFIRPAATFDVHNLVRMASADLINVLKKVAFKGLAPDVWASQPLLLDWLIEETEEGQHPGVPAFKISDQFKIASSMLAYPSFAMSSVNRNKTSPEQVYERVIRTTSFGRQFAPKKTRVTSSLSRSEEISRLKTRGKPPSRRRTR
jgi:hypothetical protein